MTTRTGTIELEVLKPLSDVISPGENADRLDTLEGKTICEIWATGGWRASETFPTIRGLLQKRFPSTKFVLYGEGQAAMPVATLHHKVDEVVAILKQEACDAVLIGNGG